MTRARDLADWGDQVPGAETAWTSYTPTWTNLTIGNATQNFTYKQIGKTVFVKCQLIFGSTTSVSGVITFTTPTTQVGFNFNARYNNVGIVDSGTQTYEGILVHNNSTTVMLLVLNASTSYLTATNTSSTVPMTWATNDGFTGYFFYEAA
jgi:hypothetical protein